MISECPCCGFTGIPEGITNDDDAVLSCEWCITNILGRPSMCSRAEEITRSRQRGADATPLH